MCARLTCQLFTNMGGTRYWRHQVHLLRGSTLAQWLLHLLTVQGRVRYRVKKGIFSQEFIAGDNDTGEQLSPVTTTLAINLLPVTRPRTPLKWGVDRRKLKGTNWWYLCRLSRTRPPMVSLEPPWKVASIGTPTHPDQRPLRQPKLNIAI